MTRTALNKERWTITFDPALKSRVQKEAKSLNIYPVQLLELLVRERLNPYGFQSIHDSLAYVENARQKSRTQSDRTFIAEIQKWQKN